MKQESIDKYDLVMTRLKENPGMTLKAAMKQEHMSMATFYAVKKIKKSDKIVRLKANPRKQPKFVDVPLKATSATVAIIITTPGNIKAILDGLQ